MEQTPLFSNNLFWTICQAAHCCQGSVPVLKFCIQYGRFARCGLQDGRCRIELEMLQRFLQPYSMPLPPISAPDICTLIVDDEPCTIDCCVALTAGGPRSDHRDADAEIALLQKLAPIADMYVDKAVE